MYQESGIPSSATEVFSGVAKPFVIHGCQKWRRRAMPQVHFYDLEDLQTPNCLSHRIAGGFGTGGEVQSAGTYHTAWGGGTPTDITNLSPALWRSTPNLGQGLKIFSPSPSPSPPSKAGGQSKSLVEAAWLTRDLSVCSALLSSLICLRNLKI